MTTIFERIDKHFRKDLQRAEKRGYQKGYKDAMNLRLAEIGRGKSTLEKFKIALKII